MYSVHTVWRLASILAEYAGMEEEGRVEIMESSGPSWVRQCRTFRFGCSERCGIDSSLVLVSRAAGDELIRNTSFPVMADAAPGPDRRTNGHASMRKAGFRHAAERGVFDVMVVSVCLPTPCYPRRC